MKKELKYNRFLNSRLHYSLVLTVILVMNFMMTDPSKDVKEKNFHKNNFMEATTNTVKNIVIVHGAFADGCGYKELYKILAKKGFNVTIVQNPLTSLKNDVDATLRVLHRQDGPTVLVGQATDTSVIILLTIMLLLVLTILNF